MADRHPSYPMMPNFNPSMLQQQQGQSQTQQGGQADNHQGMQQSFADQSQLWSQMQNLQQFRPNNGAEMNNPQMAQQMANLLQSQSIARQQQQFLGGPQIGAPNNAGGPQQPPFNDPSAPRPHLLAGGFPGLGGAGNMQPTLSRDSMQARNAMMAAFNQTHNRQLNLIDIAGNQQSQHQQNFRLGQNPSHPPGMNPVNPSDLFNAPMNANQQAMRQPSPARPPGGPVPSHPGQALLPNGQPRPNVPLELQTKIMQVRTHIQQTETSLRQLHGNRSGISEAAFMQQAKAHQVELVKGKDMLNRLIQYATQQSQQQQSQQQQQQNQHNQPPNQQHSLPGGGSGPQSSAGPSQPWMQQAGPSMQGPPFGQQAALPTQQIPQPSPNQRHTQPPQNLIMPPNRSVPTPQQQQPPSQNNQFMLNKPVNPQMGMMPNAMGPGQLPPPLEKDRFEKAFDNFLKHKGLPRDPRTLTVEGRAIDFHGLHSAVFSEGGLLSVAQRDLWSVIAGRVGFVQFPGNDVEPPKSGPATAHQIEQIYKEFVNPFDSAYIQTIMDTKKKQQLLQMANQGNPHPNPGHPARVANPQQMQMIMAYADQSADQLRANGVAENIINFIEQHRPNIQRNVMDQQHFRNLVASGNAPNQQHPPGMNGAPNRPSPASPPNPNNMGPNPQQLMANGAPDGTNQDHRPQITQQQSNQMMMSFARSNQGQLQRVSGMLNGMKEDFLRNRMHNLPPVIVPPEQRMEYNSVVEQLYRAASELDHKLPMLFLFLKNEAWIRKVAIIVVTVQQQRSFLSSSNPRFIVSLDNLRHMLQEVQKAHEGFNNTLQMVATQNMNRAHLAQQAAQQNSPPQQIPTPQPPHPSIPPQQQQQQQHQSPHPGNRIPQPHPAVAPPPPAIRKRPSMQPAPAAASPTPPPPSASTPVANAPTPSSLNPAASPKSPKTKTKAKPPPKNTRRASKVQSTPTVEPAVLPAPSPGNGVKRQREDEPAQAHASGSSPPFVNGVANEPSPPKKIKTDWEGPSNDALKQREEQAVKVETEEDASAFLEQMTELIKMAAGGEGQESLSSVSDTLDIILKGYGAPPDGTGSLASLGGLGEGSSSGARPPSPPLPSVDEFEFFDFSSFETGGGTAEDDAERDPTNEPTPDLVSSSSTNPSPESGSEADGTQHALTFSDMKGEEVGDPLRLSTMKEVDGGESAYYQLAEWKWDGPMSTLDQPWAISMS